MDETSENKTIKPSNEDRIEAFLLYELENARSSLTSEREMANGMVNHFFTLVIASMGGFVYFVTEKGEQHKWVSMYVLFVGSILLVLGLSVIIRLIKRNFDGKIFQKGRKELYSTIKTLHKETLLCSYYQTIDKLNKEVAESPWLEKHMGVGVPIALVNFLLAAAIFRYSYHLAIMLHFPCWSYVLVELLFIVIFLWPVFLFGKNGAINFAIEKSFRFVLRKNFFRVVAVIVFMLPFVAVFFGYRYRYVNTLPFSIFDSYTAFGGLLAISFQASIYFRKKHVVDAALKRCEHVL